MPNDADRRELYDVIKDPNERNNMVNKLLTRCPFLISNITISRLKALLPSSPDWRHSCWSWCPPWLLPGYSHLFSLALTLCVQI